MADEGPRESLSTHESTESREDASVDPPTAAEEYWAFLGGRAHILMHARRVMMCF